MLIQLPNKILENVINILIAVLCVAPSIIFLLVGATFGIAMLSSFEGWVAYAVLIVIPAYALFCLFWIEQRKDCVSFGSIPLRIKIGLVLGVIIALTGSTALLMGRTHFGENFLISWIFGLGPTVYLTMIFISRYKKLTIKVEKAS